MKTLGRLVPTSAFKVGGGYRVALPLDASRTWNGTTLEGQGVAPDVEEPLRADDLARGTDSQLWRAEQVTRATLSNPWALRDLSVGRQRSEILETSAS